MCGNKNLVRTPIMASTYKKRRVISGLFDLFLIVEKNNNIFQTLKT